MAMQYRKTDKFSSIGNLCGQQDIGTDSDGACTHALPASLNTWQACGWMCAECHSSHGKPAANDVLSVT